MLREQHILNETHCYRYRGKDPKYALVISHGIASHAGIYDKFCCYHAERGADIWSYDAPGHGKSTTNRARGQFTLAEWVDAGVAVAEHVKEKTGLPVFTLGSSLGVAAAFSALHSEAISGAILMGAPVVPGTPPMLKMGEYWQSEDVRKMAAHLGRAARLDIGIFFNFDEDYGYDGAYAQKQLDPWNTWSYDLGSWGSVFHYKPEITADQNEKPVLVASGEKDPTFPPEVMKSVADHIAGPVELYCLKEGSHQLMLFHTKEFSDKVHEWVGLQVK
ncbi:alpha/beta hydrolase [Amphritea japonica]|uniref:Lysophospholipase n=1 Tax=Amphritea japonica ATCC BAA-1530 TaxID=1278309 RepID=A0A7R6PMN4_9GAMM|nr:alpha/beta fold hydrolase [Amphritea japonica]BBB27110.1 lysophospholipase [Amphritea japonica ATCC BAA-1530]